MRTPGYLAVPLVLLFGCACTPGKEETLQKDGNVPLAQTPFVGSAAKGPLSIRVAEGWTSEISELEINLKHPSGASLGLMPPSPGEVLPKADYDDLIANRQRLSELTAKNGNPSINKASGVGLELYEFKSPAGEGYLMIKHWPDSVQNTRCGISGITFGDQVILVTGKYEKGDDRARKDIEAMLDTVEIDVTNKNEPKKRDRKRMIAKSLVLSAGWVGVTCNHRMFGCQGHAI